MRISESLYVIVSLLLSETPCCLIAAGGFWYGWRMENVISFPAKKTDGKSLEAIPDTDHNRNNREDQGPPIGTQAWACNCGCFAFYATPSDWRCYVCYTVAVF